MDNIQTNELIQEMSQNFIDYAVSVNSDRSIPNATDGLKPVAKRILYCAYDQGFKSEKPHVKCANIVGNVMADWHPHGDSSIYGALVRLSQNWVMRYPLIDFHGSNGNIDGDGPAAYRYTEARLAKLAEDGMLNNIKKNTVDFIPNYSETKQEPIELPAIFPNLLCNPNSGIGVAIASSWGCHNLGEVAQAIYDYIDGKEPMIYPDFPTGGIVINKKDVPNIMQTGHGSVKVRARHIIEDNKIVITELPYGVNTETLMTQIGEICENGGITGINDIRNESNKKGIRLVIECDKNASLNNILKKLFAKTSLQTTFSYNQVALVGKTPTELNLKDCIKIYINYNTKCIKREVESDIEKAKNRIHVIDGLLKALDIIDDIIKEIKQSNSAMEAKQTLQNKWGFTDIQTKAILDMKLSRLSKLEKEELVTERTELQKLLVTLQEIFNNPVPEIRKRLENLVKKHGDTRRTELIQLEEDKEEEKIVDVIPEKCVVIMTESGLIKRIPSSSFRTQKRNGKGIKNQDDITKAAIRTNTIDNLMIFSDKGKMYRLLVDSIPSGTNSSKGQSVKALVSMEPDENPSVIYSINHDSNPKYVLFITKNGLIKKTSLDEYIKMKKKSGVIALNLREGDALAGVVLVKDEEVMLITKKGMSIRLRSTDIPASSRTSSGVKGITLSEDDSLLSCIPITDKEATLAIFTNKGLGKRVPLKEFVPQNRGGKGLVCANKESTVVDGVIVNDTDNILAIGTSSNICISAKDIPLSSRNAIGIQIIKGDNIVGVSKI